MSRSSNIVTPALATPAATWDGSAACNSPRNSRPSRARRATSGIRVHRVINRRNPLVLPVPYVLALYSDDEPASLRALEPMWRAHDARAKVVGPARALKKVPILKGGEPLTGAVISDSAVVHHDAAVYGYYLTAREAGVRFELGVGAEALETKGDRSPAS